jgi:hypothetical protein
VQIALLVLIEKGFVEPAAVAARLKATARSSNAG